MIVGLGNVGSQYTYTRHNVGFMFVDWLLDKWSFSEYKKKNNGVFSKGKLENGEEVILVKPTTYMNLSGEAVLSFSSFFKVNPEDIIVIQDELDLKYGNFRCKVGGGHAGHNGIRNIDAKIGKGYNRVRIGVGHPRDLPEPMNKMEVADYVLGKFSDKEFSEMRALFEKVYKEIF